MNRLASSTDPLGGVTRYSYDASGNLTSVHDPHDHMTTFSYDSMNRLIASTDPLWRVESYQYDPNGNLIRKTKRDAATIDYLYDAANQLVQKTSSSAHPEPVEGPNITTYTYDLNSNLTGVTDPDSSLSFSYDPLDRVSRTQSSVLGAQSSPVIDYTYDPMGNRLTMIDPQGGVTSYQYDPVNRLVQLSNPESRIWNFSYDVAGRRTSLTYPNGIATTYSYNASSQLLSLHHDQSGSPVAHFDYAYDAAGNRTAKGELDGSTGYFYDALNRLTSAATTIPGLPQEFYSYDSVGNRVTSYLSNLHVHDAANQLLEDDSYTYQYDLSGNQVGKIAKNGSERWAYTYDAENQLVAVQRFAPAWETAPTMTASYGYDGLGRRISKTVNGVTTTYVYDEQDILQVGGSAVTQGPAIDEALKVDGLPLLQDGIGSVVGEVVSGVSDLLHYESFGRTSLSPTTPFGFASRELDPESDLYFMRRRFYDPAQGRFTAEDPQLMQWLQLLTLAKSALPEENFQRVQAGIFRLIQQGGLHSTYVYTHNNPILFIDPFGLDPLTWGPPQNTTLPSQLPGGKPGMTPFPREPGLEPHEIDPLFCKMFCNPAVETAAAICLARTPPPVSYLKYAYSPTCVALCGY